MAGFRAPDGGLIDRRGTLRFTFDGRSYTGHPGDTLASALIANGVQLVGRSFKYHRPRGILSAGSEEPNALVTLNEGGRAEPNSRATQIELFDGLVARSQNAWPSLGLDLGAMGSLLSPLFPAGFYYKTFIGGPKGTWTRLYEPIIRRAAGLGPAPTAIDPDLYDKRHAHCDVLVIGAGPTGLAAARAAAAGGARVILIDERARPGGSLLASSDTIDTLSAPDWAARTAVQLERAADVRLMPRTTAFGRYDQNMIMAVERLTDHLGPQAGGIRQRLWQIRAARLVIATGAHEQPLLFGNNDLPGVMMANAGRAYARTWGTAVGRRVVVATTGDCGYDAARALTEAGAEIVAVVDARADARSTAFDVIPDAAIHRAVGRRRVRAVEIVGRDGRRRTLDCDAVLMSGGWQPALHLHSHAGGKVRYDETIAAFVPAEDLPGVRSAGGCAGRYALADCLADGHAAGRAASEELGFAVEIAAPDGGSGPRPGPGAIFRAPTAAKSFVDFQNDVTAADVDLAHREGFVSVEHLKRYTTAGMATDQGKLSNIPALTRMGERLGITPGQVGTTTFRPPYTPVAFGALAGRDLGDLMDPIRVTPMHDWHVARGAAFEDVGQWKRPWYFPRDGETMAAAVLRECRAVREGVGMLDASTLGKIDIQGRDAARFLNLVYTNAWTKLAVGRCRYGVMCGEDGMVLDDGVTARLAEHRYVMFTTTGNAARVLDHLEDLLQTEWPDLQVFLTSVTDHWAASVVTGPAARATVAAAVDGIDFANDAFPHLAVREGRIGDVPVRVFRISFTGELSYEVHAPAHHGALTWEALFAAGARHDVTPYGTEAMHVLRAEKGYIIIGQETDGTVTPHDLGLDWAVATAKPDFVGKRSLARADNARPDRKQLVGLTPVDGRTMVEEGAQLTLERGGTAPVPMVGHVTSSYRSVVTDGPIALALLRAGRQRHGELVFARYGGHAVPCRVGPAMFYDPDGERMNG